MVKGIPAKSWQEIPQSFVKKFAVKLVLFNLDRPSQKKESDDSKIRQVKDITNS